MKIKTIAVLVELENGNAHQLLATKEQKITALHFLKNEETGYLQLSEEIEPIEFKSKK